MTRALFPHDDHADEPDEDDRSALPDPNRLRSDIATAPGPDLTPSHTPEIDAPPGTDEPTEAERE